MSTAVSVADALRGVTPPLVTPFDGAGEIDEAGLEAVVDWTIDGGVDALFPCGTTGEFASLCSEERRRVIEIVVDRADGTETPVVAGAGATNVEETIEYIEEAAAIGADAAVVVPPYFHTANDRAGNEAFFEAVADRAPIPLFLYNIPSCTGRAIDPETVGSLAEREEVIGIKDSSGDFGYLLRLLRETPEPFVVLQGFDNLLYPSLRVGADGGINALANALPGVYRELYDLTASGTVTESGSVPTDPAVGHDAPLDRASSIAEAIAALFERCAEVGFAPATKAALVASGVLEDDRVRPPLVPADGSERAAIGSLLEDARSSAGYI